MRLDILGIATAILVIVFSTQTTRAQLVSGKGFLQGKYLEVGMAQCGSFGSSVFAPTRYHTQGSSYLGFVADVDKDGWTSGTPGFIGDYFRPGSPEEGFTIEINGYNYSNNQVCGVNNIPGSITSVDNSGSTVTMVWEGNISNLDIKQTVEFDTNTVFFAVSVELTNNGPANLNNIYYMRNVDPDNEVPNGGSYTTTNTIVQQNPNPSNIALVKATGLSYGSILALGSKDPRARVTHGGFSNRNASAIYNGSSYYTSIRNSKGPVGPFFMMKAF